MRMFRPMWRTASRLLPALPEAGRMPYFWGMYVFIPLVAYGFRPHDLRGFWWTLAAVTCVLALYFRAFYLQGHRLVVNALLMTAIGMALAPVNPNASVFFTYSACCGAGLPRLRDGFSLTIFNVAMIGVTTILLQHSSDFWLYGVFFTLAASVPALYSAEMMRAQVRLLRKQEEVELLATLAERGRIARDMHDVLGHSLSVIVLKGQLLGKLLERDPARARSELLDIESTARDALQQLRQCVDGYRGAGLPHELLSAQRTLSAAGMQLEILGELLSLPAAIENLIVLSLREVVTNVLRHSRATLCRIHLWADADNFGCEISDDGIGLGRAKKGNGLRGLQERLEAVGGQLRLLDLSPGTSVWLLVPAGTA